MNVSVDPRAPAPGKLSCYVTTATAAAAPITFSAERLSERNTQPLYFHEQTIACVGKQTDNI
jgi:hypothetical protein